MIVVFFFISAIPVVSRDFAVELTYPISPNYSTQGLNFLTLIMALVFTWVATKQLERAEFDVL